MLTDEQIEALVVWKGDSKDPHYSRLEHARAIEAEVRKELEATHQQAIEAAVLAEREACALLADEICRCCFAAVACDAAESIAEEIRARTQTMRIDDAHKEDGL